MSSMKIFYTSTLLLISTTFESCAESKVILRQTEGSVNVETTSHGDFSSLEATRSVLFSLVDHVCEGEIVE